MTKLLLIDLDGVIYRAGFAVEKTKYLGTIGGLPSTAPLEVEFFDDAKAAKEWGGTVWSRKEVEPEDKALMLADIILRDIRDRYPEYQPELWLSPSVGNFRELIATRAKYKGNRDGAARPKHFKAIRQHLLDKHLAFETAGQEADDILGIQMSANPDSVCVSFDKDLLQIPGVHYNWVTKEEITITPKQGAINFWTQVLTGDPVDNVPGIEGIGPKKAAVILEGIKNSKECRERVLDTYVRQYGSELGQQYFNETAALVWVRRKPGERFEAQKAN